MEPRLSPGTFLSLYPGTPDTQLISAGNNNTYFENKVIINYGKKTVILYMLKVRKTIFSLVGTSYSFDLFIFNFSFIYTFFELPNF